MPTRIAINGFGRIGRQAFKIADCYPEVEVVAINDIGDVENMAYLLKYDTVYGKDERQIHAEDGSIVVGDKQYPVLSGLPPSRAGRPSTGLLERHLKIWVVDG